MNYLMELTLLGLFLSADSFSAALAMGQRPYQKKEAYLFAASSGGAEALFTLFGMGAGAALAANFALIARWVSVILLGAISLHMAYEGYMALKQVGEEKKVEALTFHSFKKIILVSFATSLDAFGVGVGLGAANRPYLLLYVLSIGLWAFLSTILGLHLGQKLSNRFGASMHFVGALILALMAIRL